MYIVGSFVFFFFFKQRTADELRISDWSSDVCSSDLAGQAAGAGAGADPRAGDPGGRGVPEIRRADAGVLGAADLRRSGLRPAAACAAPRRARRRRYPG